MIFTTSSRRVWKQQGKFGHRISTNSPFTGMYNCLIMSGRLWRVIWRRIRLVSRVYLGEFGGRCLAICFDILKSGLSTTFSS